MTTEGFREMVIRCTRGTGHYTFGLLETATDSASDDMEADATFVRAVSSMIFQEQLEKNRKQGVERIREIVERKFPDEKNKVAVVRCISQMVGAIRLALNPRWPDKDIHNAWIRVIGYDSFKVLQRIH